MGLELSALLKKHHHDPRRLVQLLRDVQEDAGWISPPTITEVAGRLGLPRARVEGVAGFYSFFATTPRGAYRVLFSDNITDQFLGNAALLERLCAALHVKREEVRADGRVSVGLTSCTGLCEQGPALLVNGRAIGRLTPQRIDTVAQCIEEARPLDTWPAELFAIDDVVHRADVLLGSEFVAGEGLRAAQKRDVMLELERSRLRGRGGAGFTVSDKWQAAKRAPGRRFKHLVNILPVEFHIPPAG
jgi:[NiFe] hydrogenase diaphorase moiety large subunit